MSSIQNLATVCVAGVALACANLAHAGEVLVSGSGTWGSSTARTPYSSPGGAWAFSFDVSNPLSGVAGMGAYTITNETNFNYWENGVLVATSVPGITFYDAAQYGLFDFSFSSDPVSFYGADVGSTGTLSLGTFSAASDVNYAALGTGTGSGTVTLAAVAAVPEPVTWAMLILGLAGIGVALRRRGALATV
jgi:hypothetical protein